MLTPNQQSNIAQWVSEFPRYSHIITEPTMKWLFAKDPPPNEAMEEADDLWTSLTKELAGQDLG